MTELKSISENVHEHCGTAVERVQGDIDFKIFRYLFLNVIPFKHGSRQAMICFFYQRLYEACIAEGIPPVWDETSEERLLKLLNRMNFNAPVPPKTESVKPKRQQTKARPSPQTEFVS